MNIRVFTGVALLGASLGGILAAAPANAQYLVGAELFAADATGATTATGYQYDTNHNSSGATLSINGLGGTLVVPLSVGSNSLTFTQAVNSSISSHGGNYGDLGLFFAATNTSYNPSSNSRTPDLIVSSNVNGLTAFFIPTAGVSVNNYVFGATPLTANGATTVVVGGYTISIPAYSVSNAPNGAFTVNVASSVTATPEPGSLALLSGLGLSGAAVALRRRRK